MSNKKKQTTKVKQQSVKEFKAWLAGMLEFQPDGWTPNVEQWKTIQDRINNLQEAEPVAAAPYQPMTAPYQPIPPTNVPINAPVVHPASYGSASTLDRAFNPDMAKHIAGPQDDGEQLMDTSHFPKVPINNGMPTGASVQPISSTVLPRIKTPDLEKGPYKSSFA